MESCCYETWRKKCVRNGERDARFESVCLSAQLTPRISHCEGELSLLGRFDRPIIIHCLGWCHYIVSYSVFALCWNGSVIVAMLDFKRPASNSSMQDRIVAGWCLNKVQRLRMNGSEFLNIFLLMLTWLKNNQVEEKSYNRLEMRWGMARIYLLCYYSMYNVTFTLFKCESVTAL